MKKNHLSVKWKTVFNVYVKQIKGFTVAITIITVTDLKRTNTSFLVISDVLLSCTHFSANIAALLMIELLPQHLSP